MANAIFRIEICDGEAEVDLWLTTIIYFVFQMKTLLGLLSLLLIFAVSCGEEDSARLLASKNVLNQLLVEGKDLTVEYVIYNVGGRWVPNQRLHLWISFGCFGVNRTTKVASRDTHVRSHNKRHTKDIRSTRVRVVSGKTCDWWREITSVWALSFNHFLTEFWVWVISAFLQSFVLVLSESLPNEFISESIHTKKY